MYDSHSHMKSGTVLANWAKIFHLNFVQSFMKNIKLPLLAILASFCMVACQKQDLQDVQTQASDNVVSTSSSSTQINASSWVSSGNWEGAKQDAHTVYTYNIKDAKISADVLANGLVLVYKKDGSSASALPFESKTGAGTSNWYYQLNEGSLTISCDVIGNGQPSASDNFKYFILTGDQIKALESKGKTRASLISLSYDQATQLSVN